MKDARRRRLPLLDRLAAVVPGGAARSTRTASPSTTGSSTLCSRRASRPYPTLYHWDLPAGAPGPRRLGRTQTRRALSRPTRRMSPRRWATGSRDWTTLNEPRCSAPGSATSRDGTAPGPTDIGPRCPRLTTCCSDMGWRLSRSGRSPGCAASASSTPAAYAEPAPADPTPTLAPPRRPTATRPLVARPGLRPRLPGGHARGLRRRPARRPRRPGDHRAPLDWLGINYYSPRSSPTTRPVRRRSSGWCRVRRRTPDRDGWEISDRGARTGC